MTTPTIDLDMCFDPVVIEVDGRISRVPRKIFSGSPVFATMFSLPSSPGAVIEGTHDDHPLRLDGVKYGDYQLFVKAAMISELWGEPLPVMSTMEAISLYELAVKWDMERLRDNIVSATAARLGEDSRAADDIYLAFRFNKPDWISPCVDRLTIRPSPLLQREMEMLGFELTAHITQVREANRSALVSIYATGQTFHYKELARHTTDQRALIVALCSQRLQG